METRRTARCEWPLLDVFMSTNQAIAEAKADLPRICRENNWILVVHATSPREWQITEPAEDTTVVSCLVDVLVEVPA